MATATREPIHEAMDGTLEVALRRLRPGESLCLDVPITVEQFFDLVDEDSNVELINGVIYMRSPVTDAHEELFGWLIKVLGQYVEMRGLGRVRGSRTAMRISPSSAREPDLMFVSTASLPRLKRLEVDGPADFIIEIVDSARARREAIVKQAQYEALGVPELWVVDLPRRELRRFVLERRRYSRLPTAPGDEVEPRSVPGFRLRSSWLFQGPDFPPSLEVVTRLLGR